MESKRSHASISAPYMPMTTQPLACPAPVLTADFDTCSVPGGVGFWEDWGYYSPGVCFIGYDALCTQTSAASGAQPIADEETAVRCVPIGYDCNDKTADQRYATSLYNDLTLSAPAFEIRWRDRDVKGPFTHPPSLPTSSLTSASPPGISGAQSRPSASPARGTSTSSAAKTGLSTRATVGVAIGTVAAICAVLGGVHWLLRRRRRGVRHDPIGSETHAGPAVTAELPSEAAAKELASNRPKESRGQAPINRDPAELPADSIMARLPS